MKQIIITVETEDEAAAILEVLEEAEDEGSLDFAFNVEREETFKGRK